MFSKTATEPIATTSTLAISPPNAKVARRGTASLHAPNLATAQALYSLRTGVNES
jgi:hypothetical protein